MTLLVSLIKGFEAAEQQRGDRHEVLRHLGTLDPIAELAMSGSSHHSRPLLRAHFHNGNNSLDVGGWSGIGRPKSQYDRLWDSPRMVPGRLA